MVTSSHPHEESRASQISEGGTPAKVRVVKIQKDPLKFSGSVSGVVLRCSYDGTRIACRRTITRYVFSTRRPTEQKDGKKTVCQGGKWSSAAVL